VPSWVFFLKPLRVFLRFYSPNPFLSFTPFFPPPLFTIDCPPQIRLPFHFDLIPKPPPPPPKSLVSSLFFPPPFFCFEIGKGRMVGFPTQYSFLRPRGPGGFSPCIAGAGFFFLPGLPPNPVFHSLYFFLQHFPGPIFPGPPSLTSLPSLL